MRFAEPWWLLALVGVIATAIYLVVEARRGDARPRVQYSLTGAISGLKRGSRARWHWLPNALRLLALAALVVALARPQGALSKEKLETEGIDIVLVLDTSGSMRAADFSPNRLVVARSVASDFVRGRENDRIGFVTFATTAITRSPLTIDHGALRQIIENTGFSNEKRTAVGSALATAVNRLRESEAESRIIILLTDGENNAGDVDPITAAQLAKAMDIRVYTIGVGLRSENAGLMQRIFVGQPTPVDEGTLQEIAGITGGQYYRAEDEETLRRIYDVISNLEKAPVEAAVVRRYREEFEPWAWLALLAVSLEFITRRSWLRGIPG